MSEYINKQQAIDLIESMIADKGVAFNPHKLAMALKDMESVEIVRCKDCIHCADDWNGNEPMFTCELARCCESVYPDDFCSYGEKQVTGKLESVEKATSEGEESTMGQPKSKLESDTISRQAAIEALTGWQTDPTDEEIMRTLKALPPVEPPKKVVAQIKIDVEEIVERIKEEYEITEKPVCEDAIRCYEFLKERIGSETTDNAEEFEKWFERMVWHVQKCNEHDTEMRNVSEDAISKHDLWRIIEDNAYWITYNETSREKGMTLTGINQALNECPPIEPKPVCEDSISRQQAIEAMAPFDTNHELRDTLDNLPPVTPTEQTIKEIMDFIGGMNMTGEIGNEAYAKISDFVDDGTPTERTGEWIVYSLVDEGRVELECPECGYALIRAADRRPHFCENCGADMRGDKE